ncbi:MAG: DNA-binding GntR family transcriptional regulator [Flavobacteriales bacterium]
MQQKMSDDDSNPEFKTQQERVYHQLREAILRGKFKPGNSVTLRGIAAMLDVSLMPVRDSLRRLTTERALQLLENRRIAVPEMSPEKLEEIYQARTALECLAATRALPYIDDQAIIELENLNNKHNLAISCGDVENYIYINFQFHRKIYSYGQPQALMPLIESLWLQIAPFMQSIFAQIKEADSLSQGNDQHRQALDAIKAKNAKLLAEVIRTDILDGAIGLQQAKGWPLSGHTSLLNA